MHQYITMKALGRSDCGNDFLNSSADAISAE